MAKKIRVRKLSEKKKSSTDSHLLLVSSINSIEDFDKGKISEALVNEANIETRIANKIANSVEKKLEELDYDEIPVSLIRDFVNVELAREGLTVKLKNQRVIGIPTFDLENCLYEKSNENSNIAANNPEAANLFIAENVLKQYALDHVFSKDIADRHKSGAIHLHDLGYIIRNYCSAHSLFALAKWGLAGWLSNLQSQSRPASHARTLTGHLQTFLASIQAFYAGALGIGFINIVYAPYVEKLSYEQMKQEAQYLIFSASQNAFSRGSQTLFLDFNVHLGVPAFLKNIKAIGPGGKILDKTYGDYEEVAQKFCKAMLEVWNEGDQNGVPFFFPKLDLHIEESTFKDPKQLELYQLACEISAHNGSTYFIFDRATEAGVVLSACCRLRETVTDEYMIEHPESMRFVGFQNVSINLPHAAFKAKGDLDETISFVERYMDLAMKAHLQKKRFIESLMKPGLPMWQMAKPFYDGKPYVDLEKATYIIGMVGLDECVKRITGKHLHEDDNAYRIGTKIISAMYLKAKKLAKENKLKVNLEESPAESAAYRLAKLDLERFEEAKDYVRGDVKTGIVYYTNSVHYIPDAPISIFERIEGQSKFHSLIESGAIVHAFIGEEKPSPKAVESLVKKTFESTQCSQLTISPTFALCQDCGYIWQTKAYLGE